MQAMRNAIVNGGTNQSLSELMNSARTATEEAGGEPETEDKLFITDIVEILMTKLTMQDMISMGGANSEQVRNIAVTKISDSRNDIRKYVKEQWLSLDLPNLDVFKLLSEENYG